MESKDLEYVEVKIPDEMAVDTLKQLVRDAGSSIEIRSVPQIFLGAQYIGGFRELKGYVNQAVID